MPFSTFGLMQFLFHMMLLLINEATFVLSQPERSQVLDLLHDYLLHHPHHNHHHHHHHHLSQKVIIPIPAEDGLSIAYLFQGMNRSVALSDSALHDVRTLLNESKSFTFITAFRQERKNVGSILSLGNENERFLELESSGWRRELRLHYVHRSRTRTETFSSCDVITDGRWHRLAVNVIGAKHVTVFIDCELRFQRNIPEMDLRKIFAAADDDDEPQLRLWIGQRNARHVSFKGAIEYIKIVSSVNGHLEQCPGANVDCPSCSQFQQLQQSVEHLQSMVLELTKQVERSNRRILELEKCECRKQCNVNGSVFGDGETVPSDERCTLCTCKNGNVFCEVRQCPQLNCKHPVTRKNVCCPVCLKHCILKLGNEVQKLDHDEEFKPRPCTRILCNDGKLTKIHEQRRLCPRLSCPKENQIKGEKDCCKICSGTDWCRKNANRCPQNSTCVSLEMNYTCSCDRGFTHVGKLCQDVDECKGIGDRDGHHCRLAYSRCVNTVGSYHCECLPGYTKDETDDDQFSCRKIDFCEGIGRNACSPHAQCIDSPGSFTCQCNEGYEGSGFECTPICREPCQNGGTCVDVGQCSCRRGFRGRNCDTDIDECSDGIASCHEHSVCVNTHGSYECRCKNGFHSSQPDDNDHGALCRDVDECRGWGGGQHCPPSAVCHNSNGSYACLCAGNSSCTPECSVDGKRYRDGEMWQSEDDDSCLRCQCKNGRVSCRGRFVSCDDDDDDDCCEVSHSCRHQDLPLNYTTGQQWNYRCTTCQCYAGGNVDCWPMECPKLKCSQLVFDTDECCPRCSSNPDPCSSSSSSRGRPPPRPPRPPPSPSAAGSFCLFQGQTVEHQQRLLLDSSNCSVCQCLSGSICCSYNQTCAAEHSTGFSSPQKLRSIRETDGVSRPRARTRHEGRQAEGNG